jgi:hypothetical protein
MNPSARIVSIALSIAFLCGLSESSHSLRPQSEKIFHQELLKIGFTVITKKNYSDVDFLQIYVRKTGNFNFIVSSIVEDNCLVQIGMLSDNPKSSEIPFDIIAEASGALFASAGAFENLDEKSFEDMIKTLFAKIVSAWSGEKSETFQVRGVNVKVDTKYDAKNNKTIKIVKMWIPAYPKKIVIPPSAEEMPPRSR